MILLASGALIGLGVAGYGLFTAQGTRSHSVPPEDIALVNQRQILRSDFMTQVQTQYTTAFAQSSAEQRLKTLNDMIDEELMVQRGLEIDLPNFDPDVRNALVAGVELEVSADALAQQPTEAELRAYYQEHKDKYASEGVMQLRDLVAKTDASLAAQAARAVANQAVMAARSGQSLGWVIERFNLADSGRLMDAGHVDTGDIFQFAVRAKLDDALYNAAIALKDGEVSEPIDEPDGVHLIAMVKHRFPVPQSFEQASDRVWSDLKTAAQAKVRAANINYLRGRADILLSTDARTLAGPAK
jgi:parvulin-like peptidyl-prolyl isomerase